MKPMFEATNLSKSFDGTYALSGVSLSLCNPSIVGLVGRNGSGKTTLIGHMAGLLLPSEGGATTLGCATAKLGARELEQIGYVPDDPVFINWMTVEQHLEYIATFYPRWDAERERRLCERLELGLRAKVSALSAGDRQKLAIVLAFGHHPTFILLDEPLSHLDPMIREEFLRFLMDMVAEDEATVVVSSHILHDIERIVDQVVCLDSGVVAADAALDDLKDEFAEWRVTSTAGALPAVFAEPFVLRQEVAGLMARLIVRRASAHRASFESAHRVTVTETSLNLTEMFPFLLRRDVQ